MKLYHLSALAPTSKRIVLEGAFTAPRQQEVVTATVSTLELYRLLPKELQLRPLFRVNCFANITNLTTFRLPATKRDFLLITSDAGTLTILAADEASSSFKRIHCETLGKTGMRRIVPGQLLASDPRGRACMVAALEKVKLCFVLNRDTEENLTISSALEANKSNTATFALVAVDVGFENPVFAALEQPYNHDTSKQLVYYELDLGLNHVSRKALSPARDSTSTMIPVPGHQEGPGGILLISADHITYCNLLAERGKTNRLECRMPYRRGTNPCDSMVVSSTLYHDKKRKAFFFMMCTEKGDLLKADMQWNDVEGATCLRVVYFDSISAPAMSMSILRAGFLIVAMEGNDAALLRFENVDVKEHDPDGGYSASECADTDDHAHSTSETANESRSAHVNGSHKQKSIQHHVSKLEFCPRATLKNLSKVEAYRTLTSLLDIHAMRDAIGQPLLLATSGRGKCASFSVLRRGTGLVEISRHVRLPFRAENVFVFGDHIESKYDSLIIVSSLTQTMVLQIHDGTIQESPGSGFEHAKATVFAGVMSNSSFVQVHTGGVRFLPDGSVDEASEWKPPADLNILAASGNKTQLVICLSSGTLVYFEVDDESGRLTEADQVKNALARIDTDGSYLQTRANMGQTALVSMQETPPGRMRASYFAAADGVSTRVRLFRIRTGGSVEPLGLQIAPAPVCSIALADFGTTAVFNEKARSIDHDASKEGKQDHGHRTGYEPMISLVTGTSSGVATQTVVDSNTGDLLGKRTMFVGLGPVRAVAFRIREIPVCLLLGSQSLLLHKQGALVTNLPLLTSPIHHAAALSSPSLENGMIAITGASLRLLTFDSTEMFSSSSVRISSLSPSILPSKLNLDLNYKMDRVALLSTPRRIIPLTVMSSPADREDKASWTNNGRSIEAFVLLETDRTKSAPMLQKGTEPVDSGSSFRERRPYCTAQSFSSVRWRSAIQVVIRNVGKDGESSPASSVKEGSADCDLTCADSMLLSDSDCILDGTFTTFNSGGRNLGETVYIVVSIARVTVKQELSGERSNGEQKSGLLLTYTMDPSTCKLSVLHDTNLSEPAHAVTSFRDMIAVGCGRSLELYSLGKKRLLKKAECRYAVPNKVVALVVAGSDRVFVGDVRESVTAYKYICDLRSYFEEDLGQPHGGKLVAIGSDSIPRWITSMVLLDYNSVVCGDKFGNVFVLRLSRLRSAASKDGLESSDFDPEIFEPVANMGHDKLVTEAYMHVGSIVTGLTLGSFRTRAINSKDATKTYDNAIIFGTIDGSLGLLVPLQRQSEIRLASSLETMMRKQQLSLCGRDHISFRSSFGPVKNVIDGDLCEMFHTLAWNRKVEFAEEVGHSVKDVLHRLEELRSSVM